MLNGSTLKIVFLVIVGTLCAVLVVLTGMAAFAKISPDLYEKLITVLGIPTLFGMIAQAFIHANLDNKDSHANVAPGVPIKPEVSNG